MTDYWTNHWPRDLLVRFVAALGGGELLARSGTAVVRHRAADSLLSLADAMRPRDGIHIHSPTMALDVDSEGKRPGAVWCQCSADGHAICDGCWVTLAGSLHAYAYVMRAHFGCHRLLPCFSGGRGWHLFVLDGGDISHADALAFLGSFVRAPLAHVASIVVDRLVPMVGSERPFTLDLFDARDHLLRAPALVASGDSRSTLCEYAPIDPLLLDVYQRVALPFFRDEWRPRIYGAQERIEVALAGVAAMMRAAGDRQLVAALDAMEEPLRRAARRAAPLPPLERRLDVFVLVMWLLWTPPDKQVGSANHTLRLPWSPHERSGAFSLPLRFDMAVQLRPRSQPLRLVDVDQLGHTAAAAWFVVSRQVVADLLDDAERSPGLGIRAAYGGV